MKLSKNLTFQRHKAQIEEVLANTPEPFQSMGQTKYRQMLIRAEELDALVDAQRGDRFNPASVAIKRDAFHKACKDMGEWLTEHAPGLELKWD